MPGQHDENLDDRRGSRAADKEPLTEFLVTSVLVMSLFHHD